MSAASVSMKVVKTMALNIKQFWMDQVQLIKSTIEKDSASKGLEELDDLKVNLITFLYDKLN